MSGRAGQRDGTGVLLEVPGVTGPVGASWGTVGVLDSELVADSGTEASTDSEPDTADGARPAEDDPEADDSAADDSADEEAD